MMHVQSDYEAAKTIRIKLLGRWTEELFEQESVKEQTEENLSRKVAKNSGGGFECSVWNNKLESMV